MSENIITLNNINKSFPGVKALDDVSFSIKKVQYTLYWEKTALANPHLSKY